jgi:hypothetical protein
MEMYASYKMLVKPSFFCYIGISTMRVISFFTAPLLNDHPITTPIVTPFCRSLWVICTVLACGTKLRCCGGTGLPVLGLLQTPVLLLHPLQQPTPGLSCQWGTVPR